MSLIPPPLHTVPKLSTKQAIKPSQESMKNLRVEIRLNGNPDASEIYKPGDTITGELLIFQTGAKKVINDIYFNDVSIRFENKLRTSFTIAPKVMLTMDNSPTTDQFPSFVHDTNAPFQSCSFPFSFTVPNEYLDDHCTESLETHRALLPSFGCPTLNNVVFNPDDVAGKRKLKKSPAYDLLRNTEYSHFVNYYQIHAQISQNINSTQKKYILFNRTMEIRIGGLGVDPIPTSIDNTLGIDSGSYYNICDVNHSNELSIIKSMNVKDSKGGRMGAIMINSLLPEAIEIGGDVKTSFPIDLKYLPKCSNISEFPEITIAVSLDQYVIQSKGCIPPVGNLETFPTDTIISVVNAKRTLYKKVQTLHRDIIKANISWLPDYSNDSSYNGNHTITIPSLEPNDLAVSTFHGCHLQNIYSLKLEFEVSMNTGDNVSCTSSKRSWTELVGFSRRRSSESDQSASNSMKLHIPIVLT